MKQNKQAIRLMLHFLKNQKRILNPTKIQNKSSLNKFSGIPGNLEVQSYTFSF